MGLLDLMRGYGGKQFPLPAIAGKYKGKSLVICADAACVWDDLERFGCRNDVGRGKVYKAGWDFMTINKMVETFPGEIEHAYSNEPDLLTKFIAARRYEYNREFEWPRNIHSCNKGAQWRWPWCGQGSSLLGGTLVGVSLDYDQIVICGGPMDNGPHNGEPHWRKCTFDKEAPGIENDHWRRAIKHFDGKVKSMSGRTLAWLGAP